MVRAAPERDAEGAGRARPLAPPPAPRRRQCTPAQRYRRSLLWPRRILPVTASADRVFAELLNYRHSSDESACGG
ncbi:hypothetical protein EVAR_54340_1 [Eumeta japonica]|uniref:Uncharacterized protein n=1 Tax=Eumeta variegata TaxID=151549 RepID=A0A4C1Y4K7_EUMVA|nr:hypothetical protein EVAR_54340_1 [Eumeta japonica]